MALPEVPYGILEPIHGELYDRVRGVEYDFWWERLRDRRPAITITYSNSEGYGHANVFPPFRPTAMDYVKGESDRILVAGLLEEGGPVLVEYRFQFEPEFHVLVDGEPFADVSALASIADIRVVEEMEPCTVQILDGRSGQFGFVREGGQFQPQVGEGHAHALHGKLSIWKGAQDRDSVWPSLQVWALPSNTCGNPEKGTILLLDSPSGDGIRYSDVVRFF